MLLNYEKLIKNFFFLKKIFKLIFNLNNLYKFVNIETKVINNNLKKIYIFNFYKKLFNHLNFICKYFNKTYNFLNNFKIKLKFKRIYYVNPINIIKFKIVKLMKYLKFIQVDFNEIDTNYYNFKFLNIYENNLITSFINTFYIKNYKYNILLRTHTSCIQIRSFLKSDFSIKIFSIGFVYRRDKSNKHLFNFNQLEIISINKYNNLFKLKYFLIKLITLLIRKRLVIRFRSSYFYFTKFSFEVDIFYKNNWLEISGMGLINNKIFNNMNLNYNYYKGFAIGLGLERLLSIIYNINNLNIIYENNIF